MSGKLAALDSPGEFFLADDSADDVDANANAAHAAAEPNTHSRMYTWADTFTYHSALRVHAPLPHGAVDVNAHGRSTTSSCCFRHCICRNLHTYKAAWTQAYMQSVHQFRHDHRSLEHACAPTFVFRNDDRTPMLNCPAMYKRKKEVSTSG